MATIRKRGSSWQAQVRRRGKTLSKTFRQRGDAVRWSNKAELDADQTGLRTSNRILERTTVADLVIRFRDTVTLSRRSCANETIRRETGGTKRLKQGAV